MIERYNDTMNDRMIQFHKYNNDARYNDTTIQRYSDTMHSSKMACKVRHSVSLLRTILSLRSRCVWTRSSRYVVSCRVVSCRVVSCSEQAVTNDEVRWKLSRHPRQVTADSQVDTTGTDRPLYDAGPNTASSPLQCRDLNTLYSSYTVKHNSEGPSQTPLHLSSARRFSWNHQHIYP